MTTTPNPTAEQVFEVAMQLAAISLGQTVSGAPRAGDLARYILRHGDAASSLSEGAPSEEQIEAAAKALAGISQETSWSSCEVWGDLDEWVDGYKSKARAALTAAGVAPQATVEDALRFCTCSHWLEAHHNRECLEHHCACKNFQPVVSRGSAAAAAALCDEVITIYEGNVGTHGPECYRWHAGCLALRVRQALGSAEFQGPVSARWLAAHDAEVAAKALEEVAETIATALPGSEAVGYYASESDSGYREAERDIEGHLRARAAEYRKAVQ